MDTWPWLGLAWSGLAWSLCPSLPSHAVYNAMLMFEWHGQLSRQQPNIRTVG